MSKQCPVTWNQIAKADFKPFTDFDWEAFAGCEGREPQIASINDCIVVVDEAEDITYIQVHEMESELHSWDRHTWGWEIPTKPKQLI